MKTVPKTLGAATLVATLAALTACGTTTTAATPTTSTPTTSASAAPVAVTGTLDATDQRSDGKSVTVSSADVEAAGKGGWIALHKDAGGKPGPVMYYVAVPAGKSADITIPTPGGITTGAYWPMLHVDDHLVGSYEFPQTPSADLPAKADGKIVMKKITVTVQ